MIETVNKMDLFVRWQISESLALCIRRDHPLAELSATFDRSDGTVFATIKNAELSYIATCLHSVWRRQRQGRSLGVWPTVRVQNDVIHTFFNVKNKCKRDDWQMSLRIRRYTSGHSELLSDVLSIRTEGNDEFFRVLDTIDRAVLCMYYHDYVFGEELDNDDLATLMVACLTNITYYLLEQRTKTEHLSIISNQLGARKRRREICAKEALDKDFYKLSKKSGKPLEFWIVLQTVVNHIDLYQHLIADVFEFLDIELYEEDLTAAHIKFCYQFEYYDNNYLDAFFFVEQFYQCNKTLVNANLPIV